MDRAFVRDASEVIRSLVCEAMPTMAVASGLVSAVPLSREWVASRAAEFEATGREARLSVVQEWLGDRGGKMVARAIREEVILRIMRRESRKPAGVVS
jgi:hypothetical protein